MRLKKSEELLGTYWEHKGNFMGTHWDQKEIHHLHLLPTRQKKPGPLVACCLTSLVAARIAFVYLCSLPFLAEANGMCFWEHLREHSENLIGTNWEQPENKNSPPPQKKAKASYKVFSLATQNFYFQNCLSPFLAWANTPIINWGHLLNC